MIARRDLLGALLTLAASGCVDLPARPEPTRSREAPEPKQDAPYVETPETVVFAMLALAGVSRPDVVYDLGSGDGRIVIGAALDAGARGVGVEIDPELVRTSRRRAEQAGVADRVRFLEQDLFTVDLREATVVTLYLSPTLNARLAPKLLRELRPGARVVSHDFPMGDWRPDRTVRMQGPRREHEIHVWLVPASVAGAWRVELQGLPPFDLALEQRYQAVTGVLRTGDRQAPVEGRLQGAMAELDASVDLDAGGAAAPWRFGGRVDGETMTGTAITLEGPLPPRPFRATRVVR